jgi:hypothetical protein
VSKSVILLLVRRVPIEENGRQQSLVLSTSSRTLTGSPFCTINGKNYATKYEAKPFTNSSYAGIVTVEYCRLSARRERLVGFALTVESI